MTKTPAEQLADDILRAAGSGLRHYSLQKTRDDILAVAQKFAEKVAELEEKLEEKEEEIARLSECEDILIRVMYWFRDVFDFNQPPRDPRKMLQEVERGLGL